MRVLHITNNYTPYNGGVVHAITNIIEEQKTLFPIGLVSFDFERYNQISDPPFVYRLWTPFRFYYKHNPMIIPYHIMDQLAQIVIGFKPTTLHIHHPFLLGPAAQKIGKILKCKTIYTYHTFYHEYMHYLPIQNDYIKTAIIKQVIRFCNSVDTIIAPSSAAKEFLETHGTTTNIQVIPSPISFDFFKSTPKTLDTSIIRLLVLSRFVPEKNLFIVFEWCKAITSFKFKLIIAGFGYLEPKLKMTAYEVYQFSKEDVQFVINPDQATIHQLYEFADFFLFTSHTDTQGLVVGQALAQGIPVLHVNGPGQKDILIDGYNGFQITSAKHFVTTISILLENKGLYSTMHQNAQASAEQFNTHAIVQKINLVYTKKN